ncbi:hypothetical protein AB6A40_004894 [Gnathostoma spinigerum]|uniref:Major facilitator superfamily (MFS) profile domain-containing protein n=1 Tax=Gnathostoma spinigerum TaxID=75299 RepID=A0ABD6EDV9_9BILA
MLFGRTNSPSVVINHTRSKVVWPHSEAQTNVCSLREKFITYVRKGHGIFTLRMFMVFLMSLCYVVLAVSTFNFTGTMVCMFNYKVPIIHPTSSTQRPIASVTNLSSSGALHSTVVINLLLIGNRSIEAEVETCPKVKWSALQRGLVLSAQNFGSLLLVVTGSRADRLNSKWMVVAALLILILSNVLVPFLTTYSIALVVIARILVGVADAFMTPSINSMIPRWIPPKERSFAMGMITGGRQIGIASSSPLPE